jgi:hypothetical protein
LGVVFYELLARRLPFHEGSIAETIDKIIHEEPEPLQRIVSEIPDGVDRVVLKCLAKDPDDRFQTAKELKEALRGSAGSEGEPVRRVTESRLTRKSRTPVFLRLSMTIGLILIIAAFLFGYFIIESKKNILQKDAAIRGRHIAHMLSLLVNDAAIGNNEELLERYVEEIGRDAGLAFIEMMRGNQVVAGYHAEYVTPEEDVLMMSYPLSVDRQDRESLKIGFSKAGINRSVRGVKRVVGVSLGVILAFLIIVLMLTRLKFPRKARVS